MNRANIYLVMAVVGAAIPMTFFVKFFLSEEINLLGFVESLCANKAAGGFTADLLISSFVFWSYLLSRIGKGPKPWLYIGLNLCIGLSCALPAYLWAIENSRGGT
ncbi:MAG: hypothetical protein ACI95C_002853 [Pseudohongiellaceae bacterium]|jgi:hypothetical protein